MARLTAIQLWGALTVARLSVPLGCAVMSQSGAVPAAWEETSFTGGPQGAGAQDLDCPGLCQCAVRPDAVPGFHKMCRVVDTPFSTISASILFELRADAGEPAALAAFHQVCAPGGPGTAELFDRAVSALVEGGSVQGQLVLGEEGGDGLRYLWAGRLGSADGQTCCIVCCRIRCIENCCIRPKIAV